MFHFSSPDDNTVERFLASQRERKYTYEGIGKTATTPPAGYQVDHTRVKLGQGIETFQKAKEALEDWQQFNLGWVATRPHQKVIREGETVCIIGKVCGTFWMNACRIVYVIDDPVQTPRFGFAYGTLPAHLKGGEERFLVEMDSQGDVWYDILAFSRSRRWLVWLIHPYARKLQKQFGRESAARMKQWVGNNHQPAA